LPAVSNQIAPAFARSASARSRRSFAEADFAGEGPLSHKEAYPAFATVDLPEPYRTTAFIIVRPELPQPAPIRAPRREPAPSASNQAPLTPPDDILPETIVEPPEQPGFDLGAAPSGIEIGDIASSLGSIPPPPVPPLPKEPVRVGGLIQPPKRLVYVAPVYPPIALAARKEGMVILEALISEDGSIRDVKVLRAEPLFEREAIAAVRQWRFSPTLLNGEPVPLVMTVTVGFSLTR
jgi:protein TonB